MFHIKRRIEKYRNKFRKKREQQRYERKKAKIQRQVHSRDFSVISNNCWGGKVYQYLDMPYLSPTAGLYFFTHDYLKFVSNLRYYLSLDLKFIPASESRYSKVLEQKNQMNKPIGLLDDIEIVFLHYPTEQEAYEKWMRRAKRVNFDHIILKMSNMNLCTDADMDAFDALPFANKILLNTDKKPTRASEVYWQDETGRNGEINNDTALFPGKIKLSKLLNRPAHSYPDKL